MIDLLYDYKTQSPQVSPAPLHGERVGEVPGAVTPGTVADPAHTQGRAVSALPDAFPMQRRTLRSPEEKLEIAAYAREHGVREACRRYGVKDPGSVYSWMDGRRINRPGRAGKKEQSRPKASRPAHDVSALDLGITGQHGFSAPPRRRDAPRPERSRERYERSRHGEATLSPGDALRAFEAQHPSAPGCGPKEAVRSDP